MSGSKSSMQVILHILCDLNGKIDGPFFENPAARQALDAYSEIRAQLDCDAMMYGQTTMAEGYSDDLWNGTHDRHLAVLKTVLRRPAHIRRLFRSIQTGPCFFKMVCSAGKEERLPR